MIRPTFLLALFLLTFVQVGAMDTKVKKLRKRIERSIDANGVRLTFDKDALTERQRDKILDVLIGQRPSGKARAIQPGKGVGDLQNCRTEDLCYMLHCWYPSVNGGSIGLPCWQCMRRINCV